MGGTKVRGGIRGNSRGIPPYIIRLNAEMVDASRPRRFRRLIVKMNPAVAHSHEHAAGVGDFQIQNDLTAEKILIKLQAFLDVGCKKMYMVNMMKHGFLLIDPKNSPGETSRAVMVLTISLAGIRSANLIR